MSTINKYIKYKNKYLLLKKQLRKIRQYGGARFMVIPNSGSIDGMSNQCMWISIRDFLVNYLGIRITVRGVRKMAGLDALTEHTSFDWENQRFRDAILLIARKFNLQINCYLVDHNGEPHPALYHDPETRTLPMPMHIINDRGRHIVNIAFYGNHFQLITEGNNIVMPRKLTSTSINKEPIKILTFSKDQIIEGELKKSIDEIIEAHQNVEVYTKQIETLRQQITLTINNLEDSKGTDIYDTIKQITEREILLFENEINLYKQIIDDSKKKIIELQKIIDSKI
jgi:hypothetical protein